VKLEEQCNQQWLAVPIDWMGRDMKVFLDTEVFLLALLSAEGDYRSLMSEGLGLELAMSDQVFSEILDVIRRSQVLRRELPSISSISLPDIFNAFNVEITRIPPSMTLNICKDPADNKYLASAMYLECDFLLTEVADLLALETNQKFGDFRAANGVKCRIISPTAFLAEVRA
jgi:putative PIN family toxin of toxin-antitoxin system